jgi:hypothetical protein
MHYTLEDMQRNKAPFVAESEASPPKDGKHYHSEAQETFVKDGKHYWKGT